MRLLPGLRTLMAAIPQTPIPAQIEFSSPLPALPASIPPPAAAQPSAVAPDATPSDQPLSEVPLPGRGPRRAPLKPKVSFPRPPAPPLNPAPSPNAPVVSQQAAPLPPPSAF